MANQAIVKDYNLKKVIVLAAGVPITGFGEDDAVSLKPISPLSKYIQGVDGEVARVVNTSTMWKGSFTLSKQSGLNALFSTYAHMTEQGAAADLFDLSIVDPLSNERFYASTCAVEQWPDAEFNRVAGVRKWTVEMNEVLVFYDTDSPYVRDAAFEVGQFQHLPRRSAGAVVLIDGATFWMFDATTSESHKADVDITNHPIDANSFTADHAQVKPYTVSVSGVITNSPMLINNESSDLMPDGIFDASLKEPRVQEAYLRALGLLRQRTILTLDTGLYTYYSMMLKSIDFTRTSENQQAVFPRLEFQELRVVDSALVPVPANILASVKDKKVPVTEMGSQGTSGVTSASKDVERNRTATEWLVEFAEDFGSGKTSPYTGLVLK